MAKVISTSRIMQQLHNRVAELYPILGQTQTYLTLRKEFLGKLAQNAIHKAVMVYRCGGSTENYKRIKQLAKGGNKYHAQRSSGNQESQGQTFEDSGGETPASPEIQTSE